MKLVSESLGVSRSQLTARIKQANEGKGARRRRIPDDTALVERIKASISDLPSYGYRRVWALLRRQAKPVVNVKRVYRVMRDHDLLLGNAASSPVWLVVMKAEWQWARAIPVGARTVLNFVVTMAPSCV